MQRNSWKNGIHYGMLGDRKRHRKIKEGMLEAFGKCFWCSIPVRSYQTPLGQPTPFDQATFDHLKSKPKGRRKGEITPKVLSCMKCNWMRAEKDLRELKTKKA